MSSIYNKPDFSIITELDEILMFFYNKKPYSLRMSQVYDELMNDRYKGCNESDGYSIINACIKKLERDAFLDRTYLGPQKEGKEIKHLTITLEGILLIEGGGYAARQKKETAKNRTQKVKDWLTITGAWSAAFALLWSAMKIMFATYLRTDKAAIFLLAVFCMLLGALLSELIRTVMRKIR